MLEVKELTVHGVHCSVSVIPDSFQRRLSVSSAVEQEYSTQNLIVRSPS